MNNGNSEAPVGPNDAGKFQQIVWIGLGIGICASFIFHFFIREGEGYGGNNVRGSQLRRSVSELLCSAEVYQVAVVYMSTRLFVNLSQVYIPMYLHETLNMVASSLALIPLIMFIGSLLTSLTIEKLNRILGRRFSYLLGTAMGIMACLWIQLRSGPDFVNTEIYIVAVLFGKLLK